MVGPCSENRSSTERKGGRRDNRNTPGNRAGFHNPIVETRRLLVRTIAPAPFRSRVVALANPATPGMCVLTRVKCRAINFAVFATARKHAPTAAAGTRMNSADRTSDRYCRSFLSSTGFEDFPGVLNLFSGRWKLSDHREYTHNPSKDGSSDRDSTCLIWEKGKKKLAYSCISSKSAADYLDFSHAVRKIDAHYLCCYWYFNRSWRFRAKFSTTQFSSLSIFLSFCSIITFNFQSEARICKTN